MAFIFLFVCAFIFLSVLSEAGKPKILEPKEKRCPPHAWKWVDQPDGSQRMICSHCGPLSKLVGPGND